ncbi:MAG: helix-turn-helix transcriptional regulator [Lachnospiraceae bacterium]|nr:helix-turn-helix transcriptional regulator [Lachnospiraceae bacterium]MBQ7780591.1 helix-turn-helix transcriptional regulator [Lachnospiraceae bacterium]
MIYFGEKLRALRLKQGMTQQQLADRIDLVKASISAYEQSAKYPSLEVLIKICEVFDVSADYMLGLSDDMKLQKSDLTDEQMALVRSLIRELEQSNHLKDKK